MNEMNKEFTEENGNTLTVTETSEQLRADVFAPQDDETEDFILMDPDYWKYFTANENNQAPVFDTDNNHHTEEHKTILGDRGSMTKRAAESGNREKSFTLAEYAQETRLPENWLESCFHLETGKDPDGTSYLKIPYCRESGSEATYLKRYANKESSWKRGSTKNICLYGEWKLQSIQDTGYVVLVEGERETQVLWGMKISALGIPDLPLYWKEVAETLQGLKVYIHQEPGKKGEKFLNKIVSGLRKVGFGDEVLKFSCSKIDGMKDLSGVYLKYGPENGNREILGAIHQAELVDLDQGDDIQEAAKDAPANLKQPDDWRISDQGIFYINPDTFEEQLICKTPIIITRRIKKVGTDGEKIEIAFKRDGEWHKGIFVRSELFTARGIIVLADFGCTVTSENAKMLVRFLSALEEKNIENLEVAESASTFGWQPGHRFIPGREGNIVMDVDPTEKSFQMAYCQSGTMDGWIETMRPYRERDKFRFTLAASFAAPLLRIIKQRSFFIYIWGNSKSGKTALLKASLSAWGDPEQLMVNFNATTVGLERTAAFYCDLPLGIDERQLAGNNQEMLEKIIYMISSGTGKVRGAKNGGIQEMSSWRTIALANGEEPITKETSQNGVSTRTIELYANDLFENEKSAGQMHQISSENYGWVGPEFVRKLTEAKEEDIVLKFNEMSDYLRTVSKDAAGSHIAGAAAVALADAMIDTWFFKSIKTDGLQIDPESWERAKQMGKAILKEQASEEIGNVNENAVQFLVDWIYENEAHFGIGTYSPWLGWMNEAKNIVYILSSAMDEALEKAGYSARAVKKYLADRKLIGVTPRKDNNGVTYSVSKYFNGSTKRVVEFHLEDYLKSQADSYSEESCRQESFTADDKGFVQISQEDVEKKLPFN